MSMSNMRLIIDYLCINGSAYRTVLVDLWFYLYILLNLDGD